MRQDKNIEREGEGRGTGRGRGRRMMGVNEEEDIVFASELRRRAELLRGGVLNSSNVLYMQ